MPKDRQFLALWKGAVGLCQYDEEENAFYWCNQPAVYAGIMRVSHEREAKFTHWCDVTIPDDY